MSLRSEFVRVGLRCLIKRRSCEHVTVERHRRFATRCERLVPDPPRWTQSVRVNAGGVAAELVTTPRSQPGRHILFLHGGAFIIGSPSLYRHVTWRLASAAHAGVLAIDYRLAPEHPFPAALEDASTAYDWLLASGAGPGRIAVIGDSAGGGLVFSLLLKLRDEGRPLPAAAVALSPWTDLALTGASLRLNAAADPMLRAEYPPLFVDDYLAGTDPCAPYASPLYGDHAGLPPTIIQVGSDEVLLDDAVRIADRMRQAGCKVELEVWPRMPHVWHLFVPLIPEAGRAIERVGAFVREQTGYEGAVRPARPAPMISPTGGTRRRPATVVQLRPSVPQNTTAPLMIAGSGAPSIANCSQTTNR
jgi:monoterpene epsilon-lactone hydrolase